jgi:hypothetical protein
MEGDLYVVRNCLETERGHACSQAKKLKILG